ncbi:MAG: hypothetical protein MJE77_18995 [Proteobacteria bacterium]|nr:hypothetical protein [Pseudomonadota bacterium]
MMHSSYSLVTASDEHHKSIKLFEISRDQQRAGHLQPAHMRRIMRALSSSEAACIAAVAGLLLSVAIAAGL